MDTKQIYTDLISLQSIDDLSTEELLANIGKLIDASDDLDQVEGTDKAYDWCDKAIDRPLSVAQKAKLEYFRANLWSARAHIKERAWKKKNPPAQGNNAQPAPNPTMEDGNPWAWEQPERQQEILCLRRCVNSPGFKEMELFRRCQIYTNLANQLNVVGRPVDAIEYWDRALSQQETFGMALGNKGHGLTNYARALYDNGHQTSYLSCAHHLFDSALSDNAFYETDYPEAKQFFNHQMQWIERVLPPEQLASPLPFRDYPMGFSEAEILYRQWCLNNVLFLNPLNDITTQAVANRDILVLPSYVTSKETPPTYLGFYNQIKQEFVSARWLLYEGMYSTEQHFSDNDVTLYDTLDYPSYSLSVEKVKIAFRIIYSLFDKIGFFLNDYMQLGIKPNRVFFRSIWYEKGDGNSKIISTKFLQSRNWPFRGLFWLSKDLHDNAFINEMKPDAEALSEIRNHLEHKYLQLHEMTQPEQQAQPSDPYDWIAQAWKDQLAYSITIEDFQNKALRLMKLARAALIYLSLGMHQEEQRRYDGKDPDKIFPVKLDLYADNRKKNR